jgi:protein O-mannosyl-transferase
MSRRRRSPGTRRVPNRHGGPAPRPPFLAAWFPPLIVAVGGTLAYLNSLSLPFLFDDRSTIIENAQIQDLWRLSVLFPDRERPVAGRPVVNVSFAVNHALNGLNPLGYHVVNVAVHVLCAVVVLAIVRRGLELPGIPGSLRARATGIAFASALIWVVHPLNSEVVDYLTQRTESMMALFFLLTFYASLRAIDGPGLRWTMLAVAACALGMGSKESMVTAPVVIILFDCIFVFDSFRDALRQRAWLYAGLSMTWLILVALLVPGPRRRSAGFWTGISPWTYLLNQPPLLARYLGLLVYPRALVTNYGWPRPVTLGDVFPSAVCIVALLALTLFALGRHPKVGFLGAWFFITLAPTSSVIPIATEVGAERRMYLPDVSLIILGVLGVIALWDRVTGTWPWLAPKPRIASLVALCSLSGVSIALGAGTVARNREYGSELALARADLTRYPTPVAHHALAETLLAAGRREEAIAHLREALPGAPRAHLTLGLELFTDYHLDEAIAELQAFIREQPNWAPVVTAHEYLGRAYALKNDLPGAVREFQEALQREPSAEVEHLMADSLLSMQAFDDAALHYRAYLTFRPDDAEAFQQLGLSFAQGGHLEAATSAFRRAVDINPMLAPARRNLATALWAQGDLDEALVQARRAVGLQPDDAGSHQILGRILEKQDHVAEARSEFQRAVQLDPTGTDALNDLRRVMPGQQVRRARAQ